ncbi:DNA-binding transcriptional regulator, LysR family [Terribacillus aidingensis]|uniref:DNA-binding transcriptional regulator, LysR family n=1 Tax=Terribacillus aidingensis TaxID=586416 RepID=A0A285P7F6_9BACI|nr:LysR family transcriptional regulator [Terribacillus aidingensis]SNZ17133.1 DNA-binding transcriptional regulator, LysR family [Terribacillus aidingensis]
MELRQLRYLVEIVKQKRLTKAAENLHISQPALSKTIKSLEEELGITLFKRSNKSSTLTDAGKVVYTYSQQVLAQLDEMQTTLQDLTDLQQGAVTIGIPPIIGSLFFPKVMARFHQTYPNVTINITEYGAARVVKAVDEGEFELGVAVMPIDAKEFNYYPIVEEEMKLMVHREHPLADRNLVELKELRNEDFIFYNEEFALHDIMRKRCIEEGFEPHILFKSAQWDFISEMVAANLGVSVLPESICNRTYNADIRIIDLTPSIPWNLAIITKKEKYISYAGRRFIEFFL